MAATSTERAFRIISVSCGRDKRSHQFPDEETVAGLHARTGRYVMVGGHRDRRAGAGTSRSPVPVLPVTRG